MIDVAALAAMATLLKPGGKILIAVPAHGWLWSSHDVVNHHHRRYSKAALARAIARARVSAARAPMRATMNCRAIPAPALSWPAVDNANTTSPSKGAWIGRIARASPSWAIIATRCASTPTAPGPWRPR